MTVFFLTTDLLFSSRVSGVAARLGMNVKTAGNAAALIEQLSGETAASVVLLDLNLPGLDPAEVVPALRAAANPPRAIIAYGPHVHEARLKAAIAADCDEVLTRGQFNAQMEAVLARWRQDNPAE